MPISDFASKIAAAPPMQISREWLAEGSHIFKVEGLSTVTTQLGKEIAILEGILIDSDTMARGTPVKDMVSLSGEQAWRLEANMRYLRSMISSALPKEHRDKLNAETIQKAFGTEEEPSILEGSVVRVRVIPKTSKNGKEYIEKNWIALGDAEQEAYLAAASEVALQGASEVALQGASAPGSKVETADEGEPVTSSLDSDEDPEF